MQLGGALIEKEYEDIDAIPCEVRDILKGEELSNGDSVNLLQVLPEPLLGRLFFVGGKFLYDFLEESLAPLDLINRGKGLCLLSEKFVLQGVKEYPGR